MHLGAILSTCAFMTLLALNVWVHFGVPPYPPLRKALQLSMFAYLLFSIGDLATYLVTSPLGYNAAVMVLYTGTTLVAVSWWLMCLRYAESLGMPFAWAKGPYITAPVAIGAALWLALLTNPWHGQFLTPIEGARNQYHWLWWVNTGFSYSLGAVSAGLYIRLLVNSSSTTVKTRLVIIISALSVVIFGNIAYTMLPFQLSFDPTPIAFAIGGTLYLVGIYRVGFFSLNHMAIRTILDQQPSGVLVNDTDGLPVYWNDAIEEFLGSDLAHVHEHTSGWLNSKVSPLDATLTLNALQPDKEAALFSTLSDPKRILSIRTYTIESWRGEAQGSSYLLEDVTAEYQRQLEKEQLQERIAQAQKLDGLGVLAGGVAHDFNNLLMSIRGNTELALLDLAEGRNPTERLKTLEAASSQAAELTHHLLTYAGQASGELKPLNLSELLTQSLQLLRTTIRQHECELKLDVQDNLFV